MLDVESVLEIQNVIGLYHHLIDSREVERLAEVFTEDAVLDLSAYDIGVFHGLAAIIDRFRTPQALTHTSTTPYIFEDAQGDVRSLSKTVAVRDDGGVIASLHNDLMRRTPLGWRSAHLLIGRPRA